MTTTASETEVTTAGVILQTTTESGPVLQGTTLWITAAAVTFCGLVLLTLLTFSIISLFIHCRRRNRKRNSDMEYELPENMTQPYERYESPKQSRADKQKTITSSQLELNLFSERDRKPIQNDDEQPLVLQELPSPPDPVDHSIIGLDTIQRDHWAQRNTSFRLAQDAKQQLLQKYQNGKRKSLPVAENDESSDDGIPLESPSRIKGRVELGIATSPTSPGPRVATVKTSNSLKHNTYASFKEHMEQFGQEPRSAKPIKVRVLPPPVINGTHKQN